MNPPLNFDDDNESDNSDSDSEEFDYPMGNTTEGGKVVLETKYNAFFDDANDSFVICIPGKERIVYPMNSEDSDNIWADAAGGFIHKLTKKVAESNKRAGINLSKVCSYEPSKDTTILESPLCTLLKKASDSDDGEDPTKIVNIANSLVNLSSPFAPNVNLSNRSLLLKEGGLSSRQHDILSKSGLCTHRTNLARLSVPFEADGSWENPGKGYSYGTVISMLLQDNLQWQYHEGKYFHTVTGCGLMLVLSALEELHDETLLENSVDVDVEDLPLLNTLNKEPPLENEILKSELKNFLPLLSHSNSDTMQIGLFQQLMLRVEDWITYLIQNPKMMCATSEGQDESVRDFSTITQRHSNERKLAGGIS